MAQAKWTRTTRQHCSCVDWPAFIEYLSTARSRFRRRRRFLRATSWNEAVNYITSFVLDGHGPTTMWTIRRISGRCCSERNTSSMRSHYYFRQAGYVTGTACLSVCLSVLLWARLLKNKWMRKPPLVKAQTALKNKNKIKYFEKRFSIWRMELLHPAMWHNHDIDFARWLHPEMWHVALESWQWIHQVAAPCSVIRGSGMTCHGIRSNVRHIGILHLV